ncbi:MAG: helix-turn-helix domain-containing protein [Caldisericum sp.]
MKTLLVLNELLETFEENFQKEVEEKEKKFKIPPEAKALGMYLRRLRKELGLSRDVAGKAVNRAPHLITYYENGYVPPLEKYVIYLATKANLSDEEIESLLEKARYVRTLRRRWR